MMWVRSMERGRRGTLVEGVFQLIVGIIPEPSLHASAVFNLMRTEEQSTPELEASTKTPQSMGTTLGAGGTVASATLGVEGATVLALDVARAAGSARPAVGADAVAVSGHTSSIQTLVGAGPRDVGRWQRHDRVCRALALRSENKCERSPHSWTQTSIPFMSTPR